MELAMPFRSVSHIGTARRLLGDTALLAFLRWCRDAPVAACRVVDDQLNAGASLDDIFSATEEFGYILDAGRSGERSYRIRFGCHVTSKLGDAGEWIVVFSPGGTVVAGRLIQYWFQ